MKKYIFIVLLCFSNLINSFAYEIPDWYFYINFGYGFNWDGASGLPHNIGFNLTFFDIMASENKFATFKSPLGMKFNTFIEYEGINYFGYEKYIRPRNNNRGYNIHIDGYYLPRINTGIEFQLFVPYIGLVPAYNFYNNNFQLFFQMRSELGWYLSKDICFNISLTTRSPDLLQVENDYFSLNLLLGIIYNPKRKINLINETQRIENEEMQRIEEQQRYSQLQRESRERARSESEQEYNSAKGTIGVFQLVAYIQKWGRSEYFHRDSYTEIARRLSSNNNVRFIEIRSGQNADIANPYNFDSNAIYYCSQFTVQQWVEASFLADISNGTNLGRRDTRIFIRNIYNIGNIGRTVSNAYLRYVGIESYTAVSGAHTVVPMFDLLLSF